MVVSAGQPEECVEAVAVAGHSDPANALTLQPSAAEIAVALAGLVEQPVLLSSVPGWLDPDPASQHLFFASAGTNSPAWSRPRAGIGKSAFPCFTFQITPPARSSDHPAADSQCSRASKCRPAHFASDNNPSLQDDPNGTLPPSPSESAPQPRPLSSAS